MSCRKGLGLNKGMGYKNIIPSYDSHRHALNAKGYKMPQRMPAIIRHGDAKFQQFQMEQTGEKLYLPVKNKTKCLSCGTRFEKDRWLFDACPICRGKNLKEIKRGGKSILNKGDSVKAKYFAAKGTILSKDPFAVKYNYQGRTYVKLSNPKYWQKGGKAGSVLVSFTKGKKTLYLTLPKQDVNKVAKELGYNAKVVKGGKLPENVSKFFGDVKTGAAKAAKWTGEKAVQAEKWAEEKIHERAIQKKEEHDELEKMTDAELKHLAVTHEDTSLFGSGNIYETELLRRIARKKEVEQHIKEVEKKETEKGFW
jgi:hypothetical protein